MQGMNFIIRSIYILSLITMIPHTHIFGLVKFNIPKTDIVHPKSGLILHYVSEYRPANKIVTFSVTIPMYSDMCYLIPTSAMGKISECQNEEAAMRELTRLKYEEDRNRTLWYVNSAITTMSMTMKNTTKITTLSGSKKTVTSTIKPKKKSRSKRLIPVIIAIGTGIASTVMSAVNLVQIGSLKAEVKGFQESVETLHLATRNNEAQILHINEGQIKVARQLANTQIALNKTMELVNEHSDILRKHTDALRTIVAETIILKTKLSNVTHALETHFIHHSIDDILSNKLNLLFVHPRDLSQVVTMVSQAMNLSTNDFNGSIPMVEIVKRLLVQQQIDFAPKAKNSMGNGGVIGKMIFTSYFAAPERSQAPFAIYQVVPIPFNQGKRRVQLAKMPAYLGIEPTSQQFIRWTKEEAAMCDLELMPSCRESPARRKEFEDDCIYQILTDSPLTDCRTEIFPDKIFIRRVGQHWAISTYNSSKCHSVADEPSDQHILVDNQEVILPELVLVKADREKSLACDRFILPKTPTNMGKPINLIYNETIKSNNNPLINLQEALANDTHWAKLPYIPSDMQFLIDFITNTPKPEQPHHFQIWSEHPISVTTMAIIGSLITVLIIFVVYSYSTKKNGGLNANFTIAMPSMKELEARQEEHIATISGGVS